MPTKGPKIEMKAPKTGYTSNPLELVQPAATGVLLNWPFYLLLIFGVALGVLLVGGFGIGAVFTSGDAGVPVLLLTVLITCLVIVYLAPAFVRLTLAMARGEKLPIREGFAGPASLPWKLFGTQLLAGLAIIGGSILLIVPGLIFMVWFSLSQYVVINEGLTGVAALKRSRNLVRNRFVDMVGTMSLSGAANILVVVPVLGAIAATIISLILTPVQAIRYLQLVKLKKTRDGTDIPASPINWLVLLLALIGLGISGQRDYQQSLHPQPVENRTQVY